MTGATGFVGGALVKTLSQNGHDVVATGRRSDVSLPVPYIAKNLHSDTDWSEALAGVTHIVHTAARVHVLKDSSSNPLADFRALNCHATLNLARQAAEAGVRRFVFISTIGVNGNQTTDKPFTEQDAPAPHNDYALSKYEAEQGLLEVARNTAMEVVIIRPPLIYGPGAPGNFATMMRWVNSGVPLPLGAVNNRRSFLALDNLVSFIIQCMKYPRAANEIFLVADAGPVSTTELIQAIARAQDKKVWLIPIPTGWMQWFAGVVGEQGIAARLFGSLEVDDTKALTLLDWERPVTMREQLQKMC